jgi:hypothetical protein
LKSSLTKNPSALDALILTLEAKRYKRQTINEGAMGSDLRYTYSYASRAREQPPHL